MGDLSLTIARAIAHDEGPLVIDLSEVQFMSAATVRVIVRTQEFLRARSRTLTLRSPSSCVQRVFDICGLGDAFDHDFMTLVPAERASSRASLRASATR
jgi:anti-anti-sigma factor